MVEVKTIGVNMFDVERKLFVEGSTNRPNSTFIYTPNIGLVCKNISDFVKPLAIQDLEAVLTKLFEKEVKIVIAD